MFINRIWHKITDKGLYAIKPNQTNLVHLSFLNNVFFTIFIVK